MGTALQEQPNPDDATTALSVTDPIQRTNAPSLSNANPPEHVSSRVLVHQDRETLHSASDEQKCPKQPLEGNSDDTHSPNTDVDPSQSLQNSPKKRPTSELSDRAKDASTETGSTPEGTNLALPSLPSSDTVSQKVDNQEEAKRSVSVTKSLETCADSSNENTIHAISSSSRQKAPTDDAVQELAKPDTAQQEYVDIVQEEQVKKSLSSIGTDGAEADGLPALPVKTDLSGSLSDVVSVIGKNQSAEKEDKTDGAQSRGQPLFVVDRQGDRGESDDSESASESESDSSDSDSTTEAEKGEDGHALDAKPNDAEIVAERNAAANALKEMEEGEGGEEGPLRTKHEQDADQIQIERPDVTVNSGYTLLPVGRISGIMEKTVVVMSEEAVAIIDGMSPAVRSEQNLADATALDAGSILVLEDRTVLGAVFETFGQVKAPSYVVRFNSKAEIDQLPNVREGAQVYSVKQLSKTVRAGDVRSKGYDSSNMFDEEAVGIEDFSDDEAEAAAKRGRKRGRPDGVAAMKNDPDDRGSDRQHQRQRIPDTFKRGGRGSGRGGRGGRGVRGVRGRFYDRQYRPQHDMPNVHPMDQMRNNMIAPYMPSSTLNPAVQSGQFGGMWTTGIQGQGMPWMAGGGAEIGMGRMCPGGMNMEGMGMGGMGMGGVGMASMSMGSMGGSANGIIPQVGQGMVPQAFNEQTFSAQGVDQWRGHWQEIQSGNSPQSRQGREQTQLALHGYGSTPAYLERAQLPIQQAPFPAQPQFQSQQNEQGRNIHNGYGYSYASPGPARFQQYPPPQ